MGVPASTEPQPRKRGEAKERHEQKTKREGLLPEAARVPFVFIEFCSTFPLNFAVLPSCFGSAHYGNLISGATFSVFCPTLSGCDRVHASLFVRTPISISIGLLPDYYFSIISNYDYYVALIAFPIWRSTLVGSCCNACATVCNFADCRNSFLMFS